MFLIAGSTRAQGIFSKKTTEEENSSVTTTRNNDANTRGGGLRAPSIPGGTQGDPGSDENTPIGGGLAILCILAGGYVILKRNVRKAHEN
ncbi:MAG: hypothetical protein LBU22_06285 [Dysgonamonadaceae bacterium]|nr:hypothetical protein [Dysgonamonadaceae bacterium]